MVENVLRAQAEQNIESPTTLEVDLPHQKQSCAHNHRASVELVRHPHPENHDARSKWVRSLSMGYLNANASKFINARSRKNFDSPEVATSAPSGMKEQYVKSNVFRAFFRSDCCTQISVEFICMERHDPKRV